MQEHDDFIEQIVDFMAAQHEAEKEGQHEFTCPLCGGGAMWHRSEYNNHIWSKCSGCGFLMME